MIEKKRYCVDIITQLYSINGAILSVSEKIFEKHIKGCVVSVFKGRSLKEKEKKIEEILSLISIFRKKGVSENESQSPLSCDCLGD